jgi:acylphosphatase
VFNEMNIAFQIIIKGRVQGVGYRYFAQRTAEQLGLCGFVRNCYNGDVEIYVEGEKEIVNHYLAILRKGPGFAYVEDLEIKEQPYEKKYTRFSIEF